MYNNNQKQIILMSYYIYYDLINNSVLEQKVNIKRTQKNKNYYKTFITIRYLSNPNLIKPYVLYRTCNSQNLISRLSN